MDTSKLLSILSGFLLLVCLTLCLTTVIVLRNALQENSDLQKETGQLVGRLDACVDQIFDGSRTIPASANADSGTDSGAITQPESFLAIEKNGKIAVYTDDGFLLRILETDVRFFPEAERVALSAGIRLESWEELMRFLQDYDGM